MNSRRKVFTFADEHLIQFLRGELIIKNIPKDAQIVKCQFNLERDAWDLLVEHESFPPRAIGGLYPRADSELIHIKPAKNLKEIIENYLIANGYDGLCNEDCGCFSDDLFPCLQDMSTIASCVPGKKKYCEDCKDKCEHEDMVDNHCIVGGGIVDE